MADTFPATSTGHSSGSKLLSPNANKSRSLSRQSSRESLNVIAHPLLSSSSTGSALASPPSSSSSANASNSTTWDNGLSSNNLGSSNNIGYVPYTRSARNRPAPASPTHSAPHVSHASSPTSPSVTVTPATTSSASSSVTHQDATAKLQLMNLKAAAQALGLDASTVGWAILETLASEHGPEWDPIWEALSSSKATLLLPSEPMATLKAKSFVGTNASVISPAFVATHVIFTESDGKASGRVVSLSGLRGIFGESKGQTSITFTSTLHPQTQSFHDILSPGTRTKGFSSFMPLTPELPSSKRYKSYILPTSTSSLSIPPRGSLSLPPPLPPRRNPLNPAVPGINRPSTPTVDTIKGGNTSSRFAGFASLFGSRSASHSGSGNPSSPVGSRPPSIILSDTASIVSIEGSQASGPPKDGTESTAQSGTHTSSSISVPAYTVSTSIVEQEVLGGIWKGIVGDVERILRSPSDISSEHTTRFPSILPSILISFLESANALSVLRASAPHPRVPNKSKAMTRRLISGSGSVHGNKDGKEGSDSDLQSVIDATSLTSPTSSFSTHAHADSEYFIYEINPYGVKEGWGSASMPGANSETGAMEAIDDLSVRWQAVYREVEDVVVEWAEAEALAQTGEAAEKVDVKEVALKEYTKKDILERAERILCCIGGVYERLLPAPSPCTTWTITGLTSSTDMDEADPTEPTGIITDSAHDDALASRIAALVMVDFGLRDLDLDVSAKTEDDEERKSGKEDQVMDILRACGNELCALEKVYTPREKAEAMVKAHRVLVDGLTKLPFAIDLKEPGSQPESELESEPPLLSGQKQDASEEELKTAVPWKKDDAFPQQIDDEDIDVSPQPEQEAELGKTSEVTEEMRIREPASKEQGNIIDSENSQSSPSLVATPNTSEITSSNRSAPAFSLDTLFPLLILSVVIANPPRLISHLLFTQRFLLTHQSQTPSKNGSSAAGEQAYCLVNLMAVAEFIGSLDLEGVVNARTARGTPLFSEDGPMPMPVMSLPITIGSRSGSRRASMSSQHSVVSRDGSAATTPVLSSSFTLRNRVEQQASALSSSANKVLTGMSGVMDSSIGGFGGLFKNMNVNLSLPGSLPLPGGFGFGGESSTGPVTPALDSAQSAALWNQTYLDSNKNLQAATSTPRDMMERKESGFSIKGLKLPSIPNMPTMPTIPNLTRSTAPGPGDAREKEMVNVSRPGSARSMLSTRSKKSVVGSLFGGESTEEDESEDVDGDEDEGTSYGDEDEDEAGDGESYDDDAGSDASDSRPSVAGDNRSIRSFESMMSDRKRSVKVDAARRVKKEQQTKMKKSTPLNTVAGAAGAARKSLSDRLARVSSGIAASTSKKGPPPAMLLSNPPRLDSPQSSQPPSPVPLPESQGLNQSPSSLPPPNSYFLGCTSAEDLRLGEVKELLREYQSLVQAVQAAGGYSLPATGSLSENPLGDL